MTWIFLGVIIIFLIAIFTPWGDNKDSTETIIEGDMKYNHRCPFCKGDIPKIYQIKTITKRRRHKVKMRTIKEVIGEDWATHVKTCGKLKEFLNKTKEDV
jgi:hypothetical protein